MGKKNQKDTAPSEEIKRSETDQPDASAQEEAGQPDELTRLQEDFEAQKDLLLRTAAEFDNYKKRTAREMERIGADSRASVVKALLPAVDNFLRAQDNAEAKLEDYKKGVDMSIKQLMELLQKLGMEEIPAEGQPFDPNVHYAVSRVEDEAYAENTVVQVMQKGYRMGEIVLRPAMVSVANC